jgi:glycosyltransferase involved in cell wall biosynthesis
MNEAVSISICIPVYKNIVYLKRLLDSILIQTFTDYEIIITDDSPGDEISNFLKQYEHNTAIKYFKNTPSLGTPENWNEGIRRANGKWIKIMHDDDWFAREDALAVFSKAAEEQPDCHFFFAAFQNVIEETKQKRVIKCTVFDRLFLKISALHLFKRVYIGNPSCTFVRKDLGISYDRQFKFVVDFEYYIRVIKRVRKYRYINEVLLNIGFNSEQVTKYTYLVPAVQVPENLLLLDKMGTQILYNVFVYDYYWRMFRNLSLRSVKDVCSYYEKPLPSPVLRLLNFQSALPAAVIRIGVFSKIFMVLAYLNNLLRNSR